MDEALNQSILLSQRQQRWTLTADALARLLNWLDGGNDSQGQNYEETRWRLAEYFERRGCLSPDDLVDETFNRVMKWLVEQNKDYDQEPLKICYHTARFVFQEYLRKPDRVSNGLDALPPSDQPFIDPQEISALEKEEEEKEKRLACLAQCLQKLPAENQELILNYYGGERRAKLDNRKALAADRRVKVSVLRNKAYLIRERLRACVMQCLGQ